MGKLIYFYCNRLNSLNIRKEGVSMSELVVLVCGNEYDAEKVRLDLLRMEHEHLADLEDAVVVVRTRKDKIKLHHMTHLTSSGAVTGGFLGALMGVILLNPVFSILGLAAGAAIGGISGSRTHLGIETGFVDDLAEHLKPGTSTLCILVRENLDAVLEELKKFEGKVFRSSLTHEDEEKLLMALESKGVEA
jgi:uncharacterized membrane protein